MQHPLIPIEAALKLLPSKMDTPEARAMLLAIGFQESRFQYRRQIGGPARGYWQFESGKYGGVAAVLHHHSTRDLGREIVESLDYRPEVETCYYAIEHNDILAAVFARLLLYQFPGKLPPRNHPSVGWEQYLRQWSPGKPHPETWQGFFDKSWAMLD